MKRILPVLGPVLIIGLVALLAYIRLAPSNPERWHSLPQIMQDQDLPGGVMRVLPGSPERFGELASIIEATPRTRTLAGSREEEMITFVTRSLIFGFPDYTTIRLQGQQIWVHSRLRFGKSDLGVNGARLEEWLTQLGQD